MAGIAGIAQPGKQLYVNRMLDKIQHRGRAGREVQEAEGVTLGAVWNQSQPFVGALLRSEHVARDEVSEWQATEARALDASLDLVRDPLGVRPLYYGRTADGTLCFASEVKALLEVTRDVNLLPPGHLLQRNRLVPYYSLVKKHPRDDLAYRIGSELRRRLQLAVQRRIGDGDVGVWLSGGVDSSAIAALARPCVSRLHTFSVGLPGAPDLEYAHAVAECLRSEHHPLIISTADLIRVLSEVIYHLESFDASLVRSGLANYLLGKLASDYVGAIFTGVAADELFAGHEYLETLPPEALPDELVDMLSRLHNTSFQRVDRCASAHGLIAHVPFAAPPVVDFALQIPTEFKLRRRSEKWILRVAMEGMLPNEVVWRRKTRMYMGVGIGPIMAEYAANQIGDLEFSRQRGLPNGWELNSKEELLYYRLFQQHFGELDKLEWMGRTKQAATR